MSDIKGIESVEGVKLMDGRIYRANDATVGSDTPRFQLFKRGDEDFFYCGSFSPPTFEEDDVVWAANNLIGFRERQEPYPPSVQLELGL